MEISLAGQVAIVTGAARGVGREIVRLFVEAGAEVAAVDRDAEGLRETCAGHGERVLAIEADVSAQADAARIVAETVARFGRLDCCVNNAAVAPHTALLEERPEVWDTVFAVNCRGTFLMTQAAARALIAAGSGGRIVNFSSGVSARGSAGAAAYAASRAATESFTRTAAIELAPHGILVSCISPGLIDTQPKPLPPGMAERLGKRIPTLPLARAGRPEEVAQVVLFLASPLASYVSGNVIHVDGAGGAGPRPNAPVIDDDVRYDWVTGRQR